MKKVIIIFVFFTIGWQGIVAQCFPDRHNTTWYNSWISCEESENPNPIHGNSHWILYNFGSEYTLYQTNLWNLNDTDNLNNGIQDYIIDYSIDGSEWINLGTFSATQANGLPTYEGEAGPNFNEVTARYVLLTPVSNYGGSCYGISEIKFNLNFEESNTPPVANNDTATTDEDIPVVIAVLDNDSDSDGTLVVESVMEITAPTNGTVITNTETGEITYLPNSNFYGTVSFEYQVCDDDNDCDTATVQITVNPINDQPIVNDDMDVIGDESSVTTNVLANDMDLNDPSANIDPSTISIVTNPSTGSVIVNSDGTITYTRNSDFNEVDTYVYNVCDDGFPLPALCDNATVTITQEGVAHLDEVSTNTFVASVFPNPFSNEFVIMTYNASIGVEANFSIYDLLGRLVLEKNVVVVKDLHQEKINLSKMQSGLYFVKINQIDKEKIIKIIKN